MTYTRIFSCISLPTAFILSECEEGIDEMAAVAGWELSASMSTFELVFYRWSAESF